MSNPARPRIRWIDLLRGACVCVVLIDHTQDRYAGLRLVPYEMYVTNAMLTFVFLSGYLFYKPEPRPIGQRLKTIARGLLLPYFIFTIIMALPKLLAYGESFSWTVPVGILGGYASWFVAALAVSQVLFALLIHWAGQHHDGIVAIAGTIAYIAALLLARGPQPLPWQADDALLFVSVLAVGYLFRKHETRLAVLERLNVWLVALTLLLALKVAEWRAGFSACIWNLGTNAPLVLAVDVLLGFAVLVPAAKWIGHGRFFEWIGRRSIVFYFLNGGATLLVSRILLRAGLPYDGQLLYLLFAFLLVLAFCCLCAWIVFRFFPWAVGKRAA